MKTTKKVKEVKYIDYSKMPDHIWDKVWSEFLSDMAHIETSISSLEKRINYIERYIDETIQSVPRPSS
jgi:hypothetical protein